MPPLLEVQNLEVGYILDGNRTLLIKGVDLAIERGEILGIAGESGSGKSVLLQAILGLLRPPLRVFHGRVIFRGEDLRTMPEHELEMIRGKRIALTLSNPRQHLNPVLPIGLQLVNVIRSGQRVSKAEAVRRAVKLLQAVGISDAAFRFHSYPHELSGGMAQRVIIAMGLANSPELLMADEPTTGLDVTISVQILDLMIDLVREFGSSLLIVSRDLGVIANYCQKVAVMHAGLIVEEADVFEFFDRAVHPYSRHLKRAAEAALERSQTVDSTARLDKAGNMSGCQYVHRCPVASSACTLHNVPLEEIQPGHRVRCNRKLEIWEGRLQA